MKGRTLSVEEYCAILWEWLDLIAAHTEAERAAGREPRGTLGEVADARAAIRLAVMKSSYLLRRIYGGEERRITPCPTHRGTWSGLLETCACGGTGWLPNEADEAW